MNTIRVVEVAVLHFGRAFPYLIMNLKCMSTPPTRTYLHTPRLQRLEDTAIYSVRRADAGNVWAWCRLGARHCVRKSMPVAKSQVHKTDARRQTSA
ncbi:hypothetical protein KCU73_g133, partial [Aureobasidium melanogenum]